MVPLLDIIQEKFGSCRVKRISEQYPFYSHLFTISKCNNDANILFVYDNEMDMFCIPSMGVWYTTKQFGKYLNLLIFS